MPKISGERIASLSPLTYFWKQSQTPYQYTPMVKNTKGQPDALKLPHTQGPGRGPTVWCIVRSLTLFLHKRLFPGLELVTLQSHDNNFTSCANGKKH